MSEKLFSERIQPKKALLQDLAGGAESPRLFMGKSNSVSIVMQIGVGVATTFDVTLRQHKLAAAGDSSDLISSVPYYFKVDADAAFTRVDGSAANILISEVDTAAGTVVIEIYQDDMANEYEYISLVVAAPGASRLGSVEYMVDTKNKPAYQIEL